MEKVKLVEFNSWCERCKHYDKDEADDPCFDCLCDPVNVASHKPTKFEEAKE